jgi:hypothetical protein
VSGGTAWAYARSIFNIDQSPDNTNWFPVAYGLENGNGGRNLAGNQSLATATTGYLIKPPPVGSSGVDIIAQGILLPPIANGSGLAAAGGEVDIPFEAFYPYVRLTLTTAGSGASPTITYNGFLGVGWP